MDFLSEAANRIIFIDGGKSREREILSPERRRKTMTQIERITEMEKRLNCAREALDRFSEALSAFSEAQEAVRELNAYYGSDEWNQDYDDDQAGRLPQDLPRGVLTEDAVYDLLTDNRELLVGMLETAADITKWGLS